MMSRIIKWLDLWLITVVILSCIPAITKCEWTSLRNVTDLSAVNMESIVMNREQLIKELSRQKEELMLTNANGENDAALLLIDSRIKHLTTLEEVLKTSLDIFNFIVSNKNSSDLDNIMEQESLMIIDEFQRLVLKTKNDQNSIKETKKTIEKTQQQQNSEDATTKSPETANSHHFQTPANSTGSVSDASTQQQQDNSQPKNAVDAIVGGVMKNVANEADKLETDMKHDSFAESQKAKGTTVETVLKVDGSASSSAKDGGEHSNAPDGSSESGPKQDMTKEAHAPLLIDSENNQYVLSKSGDGTAHVEDVRLLSDILLLLIVCALGMLVFHALGMPSFFAYILAGVVLGQQGLIKSDVQVETISRGLGVLFIMFFLGLEFNPDKIRKVWNVSIFGSILMLGAMLLVVTGLGVYVLNAKYAECFIVGSCLFLSSTAVILHVFKPGESETVYGRSILGILITQDVLLGLLLVMMPALKSSGLEGLKTLLRNLALLIVFLVECAILRKPFIQILQWLQRSKSSDEIFLLSCIGICLFVIEVGKYLEQSLELSCFVAGVAISSRQSVADTAIRVIEPLRGLFAALFFASIGLHIFPTFFIHEGLLLVSLTLCVVLLKMVVVFGVFRAIFTYTSRSSLTIAVGLGQISEFTFVLASKAKSADLLSREVYYLLIGITTLSMFVSPLMWFVSSFVDGRREKIHWKRSDVDLHGASESLMHSP